MVERRLLQPLLPGTRSAVALPLAWRMMDGTFLPSCLPLLEGTALQR